MNGLWRDAWAYWTAGGPLLVPIAVVCFGIWFYFVRARLRLLKALRLPADFDLLLAGDLRGDLAAVSGRYRAMPGLIARAVAFVVEATREGRAADEAFDAYQSFHVHRLRRDQVLLVALTAMAPLLGLLGTVIGMVHTFDAVSSVGGSTTVGVSSGISTALITTQFGLLVAIPGVFGIARLKRLVREVEIRFAMCRTQLLLALGEAA